MLQCNSREKKRQVFEGMRPQIALAAKISGAWVAFAHTGNPSQKGLAWPAYTSAKRATMILDDKCGVVDDPRKEVRLTLASLPAPQAG